MPKFKIRHVTKYLYESMVRDSANQIVLYPVKDEHQDILQHAIEISGDPAVEIHTDHFGNEIGTFTHSKPHRELMIDSKLVVRTKTKTMPEDTMPAEDQWKALEKLKFQIPYIDFLQKELFQVLPELEELIRNERCRDCTPLETVKDFSEYIFKNFTYQKGITTVESTIDEIWGIKSGVCQDFAHILLVLLRLMNIPARYVSGYICPNKNDMRGEGATHAWVEAFIPFYGWLGFDPTNNCIVNETHVRLAVGKSFSDCSPVKGTYRGSSDHTLEVSVSVAYEDGHTAEGLNEVLHPQPVASYKQNSYRKHQEIQMQQ